jgi:hypothetical protein
MVVKHIVPMKPSQAMSRAVGLCRTERILVDNSTCNSLNRCGCNLAGRRPAPSSNTASRAKKVVAGRTRCGLTLPYSPSGRNCLPMRRCRACFLHTVAGLRGTLLTRSSATKDSRGSLEFAQFWM